MGNAAAQQAPAQTAEHSARGGETQSVGKYLRTETLQATRATTDEALSRTLPHMNRAKIKIRRPALQERRAGLHSYIARSNYPLANFRLQIPIPANPAPRRRSEEGSGTPRLVVPASCENGANRFTSRSPFRKVVLYKSKCS